MKQLIIMGANNPEIIRLIDIINSNGIKTINIVGFIDNDVQKAGKHFMNYPILGSPEILKDVKYQNCYVINNITRDCHTRFETTKQLMQYTNNFLSLVHPSVEISYVEIGEGVIIHEGCIISPRVVIEDHTAVMIGAQIAHDSVIKRFSFIGPGANICGNVLVGNKSYIGAGAIILPRFTIGDNVMVGAGSLVIKSIKNDEFVMGNPARSMPKKSI